MEARSVDSLQKAERQVRRRAEDQKSCEAELKSQIFPFHCLVILQNETVLTPNWVRSLDSLCAHRVHDLVELGRVDQILKFAYLPQNCRTWVRNRGEDLKYIQSKKVGPEFELNKSHESVSDSKNLL